MVGTILTSTQLVLCYSNDLIDNSMIEHGKLIPHLEFGSPEKAILEIIEVVRTDCQTKKLALSLQLEGIHSLAMKFDRQRLQQVVLNLAKNAIKFSHTSGEDIVISSRLVSKPDSLISESKQLEVSV